MQKLFRSGLTGVLLVLTNACTTAPSYQAPAQVESHPAVETTSPSPVPQKEETQVVEPATEAKPVAIVASPKPIKVAPLVKQSPAVIALLDNAQKQQQRGDLRSAQNTLQRAQRIAPRDPEVYYALAQTHMKLETYSLAEQVALKGVSLVQGQAEKQKKFWLLIATIRLQAGNPVGAEKAKAMAARY